MKGLILSLLCAVSLSAFAQNDLQVQLFAKYDGQDLVLNQVYTDPNGYDFKVTRLEFYLHNFSVTHDGGQTTDFSTIDNYVLAEVGVTNYPFGSGNVSNVESISFTLGVDGSVNHDDPTQYVANHPLGLQSPSMHWGWSSGYRFLALEMEVDADGDGTMETLMQSHVVGDNFLTPVNTINIANSTLNGNTVVIPMDYELKGWLDGLNLATAGVNHGGGATNTTIMNNTNPQSVFKSGVYNSVEYYSNFEVRLFTNDGQLNFASGQTVDAVEIYDMTGKVVLSEGLNKTSGTVSTALPQGIYVVRLRSGDQFVARQLKF